jgi:hypothetical protein
VRLTGHHVLVGAVVLVVVAAIAAGIVMIGSPDDARALRMDGRRVEDLQGIERAVNFYRSNKGRIPASLDELGREPGVRIANDPATGVPYSYRPAGAAAFELCGTFERDSVPRVAAGVDQWEHPAGRHCFTLTVRELPRE